MKLLAAATVGIASALVALAHPGPAKAEDDPDACRPRAQTEGPWSCTYLDKNVSCPPDMENRRSDLWKIVDGVEQAKSLLRAKYYEMGEIKRFAGWLACQGFEVKVVPSPDAKIRPGPRPPFNLGPFFLELSYSTKQGNIFNDPWREHEFLKSYRARFLIAFNYYGQIFGIGYDESNL